MLISWLPSGLDIPSWTFFNSPFCIDFKTSQFVMIWWNFDRDIAKILKESHFKNQHLLFINESRTWTLRITQEYSGALKSTHEQSWALVSTDMYGAKALWVGMAPWHQAHKCSLLLMSAVGAMVPCSWVLMATYECSWILMNAYEYPKCDAVTSHEH